MLAMRAFFGAGDVDVRPITPTPRVVSPSNYIVVAGRTGELYQTTTEIGAIVLLCTSPNTPHQVTLLANIDLPSDIEGKLVEGVEELSKKRILRSGPDRVLIISQNSEKPLNGLIQAQLHKLGFSAQTVPLNPPTNKQARLTIQLNTSNGAITPEWSESSRF